MPISNSTDRFNGVVASLAIKVRCVVGSEVNVASLSGISNPYSGVFIADGDRVLLTAQNDPIENGVWDARADGIWFRAFDWDGNRDVEKGSTVWAGQQTGLDKMWQVQTTGVIIPGSTPQTITELFNPASVAGPLEDVTTVGNTTTQGMVVTGGADMEIEDGGKLTLKDPTDNTAFVEMYVTSDGDNLVMDFTNIGDVGSNGGVLMRATGNQPTNFVIEDFATLRFNSKRNSQSSLVLGETTTLRGDSAQSAVTLYGEDGGTIAFGQLVGNGDRLWLNAFAMSLQFDAGTGRAAEFNVDSIKLSEVAAAIADETGYGQIWVNSGFNPSELYFTDETGNDINLIGELWNNGTLKVQAVALGADVTNILTLLGGGSLYVSEKSSGAFDVSGQGQFWVRDDVPNVPMFTNEDGEDFVLNDSAAGGASVIAHYRFDTSTSEADPGNGDFRMDNATPASVTEIFVSETTDGGNDFTNVLGFLSAGDQIYIQQDNDAARFILITVTANVDNGTWVSLACTVDASGTLFESNSKCTMLLLFGGTGGAAALDDLTDVDLTGAADNDLLYRSGGDWIDTAGLLTWDGTSVFTGGGAGGDLTIRTVDATSGVGGNVTILSAGGQLAANAGGDIVMEVGQGAGTGASGNWFVNTITGSGFAGGSVSSSTGPGLVAIYGVGVSTNIQAGNVEIWGGYAGGSNDGSVGGSVMIWGGGGGGGPALPGDVCLFGGNADDMAGNVELTGGFCTVSGGGGDVIIAGGPGFVGGAGGDVTIDGGLGIGTASGGVIGLRGGDSGSGANGVGGDITLTGGDANSTNGSGGDIVLDGGTKTGSGVEGHVEIRSGTHLRQLDSSNADYLESWHDGTNFQFFGQQTDSVIWSDFTGSFQLVGFSTLDLRDATTLAMRDADNSHTVSWTMDGTDLIVLGSITENIRYTGTVTRLVPRASSTTRAGFQILEGVAPTSPDDGDIWVTAAGEFFARLNGESVDLSLPGNADLKFIINADINTGSPPSTENVTARLVFEDADGTDELGWLGFFVNNDFLLRNKFNGGSFFLTCVDSGFATQAFLGFDPDGDAYVRGNEDLRLYANQNELALQAIQNAEVSLYHNAIETARTDTLANGGFFVNNTLTGGGFERVLTTADLPDSPTGTYTRNATVVEDRTLLASASATTINNNNVLAALIADLTTRGIIG